MNTLKKNISSSYKTREFKLDDVPQLYKLYVCIYGESLSLDSFSDKFLKHNIANLPVIGVVALKDEFEEKDEIVAFYGVFPLIGNYKNQTYRFAQSGDTMTHPQHQGKGLFVRLANETYDLCRDRNVDLVFGFPNKNSAPGFFNKLNWKSLGIMRSLRIPVFTLPLHFLLDKLKLRHRIFTKIDSHIARKIGFINSNYLVRSSVLEQNLCGVNRGEEFQVIKGDRVWVMDVKGAQLAIRLGVHLDIGDIAGLTNENYVAVFNTLRKTAFLTGRNWIRFFISSNSSEYRLLSNYYNFRNGLEVGILPITDAGKSLHPFFTYLDYDTF